MILAIAFGLLAPVLVVALAGPNYDEPTPPIGWWFVIVTSELFGVTLVLAASGG